ncbi:MAG: hypothetical protein U1F24_02820 [Alphaproteobacteria bacterium]|jgi:hypothetical protein
MMWDAVQWSLAGQVADFVKLSERGAAALIEDEAPEVFFDRLRAEGAQDDALAFLAAALPRRAAIAWGRDCVGRTARSARLRPADMAAYSAVGAWLEDPSDDRRRVAFEAAGNAEYATPEALLALAVFLSGGSIAAAECPQPAPVAPDICGRIVGAAVTLAAVRVPPALIADTKSAFLDRGRAFATGAQGA